MTRDYIYDLLYSAKEANMNMLRVNMYDKYTQRDKLNRFGTIKISVKIEEFARYGEVAYMNWTNSTILLTSWGF